MLVIVMGAGHSGTRVPPALLRGAGFYLGKPQEVDGANEIQPPSRPATIAKAAREMIQRETPWGPWDLRRLVEEPIPEKAVQEIREHLKPILGGSLQIPADRNVCWKTTPAPELYPWLVRIFPDAHFLYWTRHPADWEARSANGDSVGRGPTDDGFFRSDQTIQHQAIARWTFCQRAILQTTRPKHLRHYRFEDWVNNQTATLRDLENWLQLPSGSIPPIQVRAGKVGKPRKRLAELELCRDEMITLGYPQNPADTNSMASLVNLAPPTPQAGPEGSSA